VIIRNYCITHCGGSTHSNRTRVAVTPIGGHPGRSDASHCIGGSQNFSAAVILRVSLSLTSTVSAVNRLAQIAQSAILFDIGFVDAP
jgi:hypothetical protein